MKKLVSIAIVVAIVAVCGFYLHSCADILAANAELNANATDAYKEYASKTAYRGLDICHPFMYEDDYGSMRGRLEEIPKIVKGFFSITDEYEKVLFDVSNVMERKIQWDNKGALSNNMVIKELGKTPRDKVVSMGSALQSIHVMTVTDCESVTEAKKKQLELEQIKLKLSALLN